MSDPTISVIVPVHNRADTIALLLASLRNQTETSLEIIAVDDGSTDLSLAMLDAAAAEDPRIIVVSQRNQGVSAARNQALNQARGRWIAFADSDDWLAPTALATWLARAEAQQLDMLIGNGHRFLHSPDEAVVPLCRKQPWGKVMSGPEWIVRAEAAREWPHWSWLQFISHAFLKETNARFVEGMLHEDTPWTLQLALAARRVGFEQTPFYAYRVNPASLVRTRDVSVLAERARGHIRIIELLAAKAEQHRHEPGLRRALLRDANRRGNHFRKLVRKHPRGAPQRQELTQEFLASGALKIMFRGGGGALNFGRALLCWLSVRSGIY